MPILPDGTIVAPGGDLQYVTRVVLEFHYRTNWLWDAQRIHNDIIDSVSDGANQLGDAILGDTTVNVGYAKEPHRSPGGEGEDGVLPEDDECNDTCDQPCWKTDGAG